MDAFPTSGEYQWANALSAYSHSSHAVSGDIVFSAPPLSLALAFCLLPFLAKFPWL